MTRQRSREGDQPRLPVPVAARPAADQMTDVVVVGATPGGLAAALACRQAGWEVLVVEAGGQLGGDEAAGAGRLWLPGRAEMDDDYATARNYLDRVVGDPDAASSAPRRHAMLTGVAELAGWLAGLGVPLRPDAAPDEYPQVPGGRESGRVMVPTAVDATMIGRLAEFVPDGSVPDSSGLVDLIEHGARSFGGVATGRRIVHGGAALVCGLLAACQRLQVNIWWDAPVSDLVTSESAQPDAVTGVVVRRGARDVRVLTGRGVILAQGGFGGDAKLRRELLPQPSRVGWSLGTRRTDGVRHFEWADRFGLQQAGLGNLWWRPALWHPDGGVWDAAGALAAPHGFVVDRAGRRFVNEAGNGTEVCLAMLARAREQGDQAVPVWLIIDSEHRRRYRLGDLSPGRVPRSAGRSGFVVSARSLPELAWRVKVDAAGLQASADRFDHFCTTGTDDDFGRGTSRADRCRGDRGVRPNPCLGPVGKPPFHAVRVVPGDLGTKGGLATDEFGRVLRLDGTFMPGLWAIGSAAASISGATDPAPGFGLAEQLAGGRACAGATGYADSANPI